jgi:hypothetical protein
MLAGCSTEAIVLAIGLEMRDLFHDPKCPVDVRLNGNRSHTASKVAKGPKVIVAVYPYEDADGIVLYENVRYLPKDFRQRRPGGNGGYIYDLNGISRVPYRLTELIEARRNGVDEIWLTEGEKDADNLRLLGFTVTNFKNWTQSLNPYIKGADAVLLADHDASGEKQVTDRLNRMAAKHGIAIVGIRHINKSKGFGDARNAGAHSVAWLQGCRSGLIVGHDAEDKSKRGIAQHKLNIAAESSTVFGFEIDEDGAFTWTGESDLTISAMLAHKANESNEDRSAIADAIRFLKEQLAQDGKYKSDLDNDARGEGISPASLNRAKGRLKIKPQKTGMHGGWYWELPEDAQT